MTKMFLIDFFAKLVKNILPGKKTILLALLPLLSGIYAILTNESTLNALCVNINLCLQSNRVFGFITAGFFYLILIAKRASEMIAEERLALVAKRG